MKRWAMIGVLLVVMLALTGCLAGPNPLAKSPREGGEVAGFWKGLWQGMIAPVTFVISLFADEIHFYEVHNNGNWYNLGFALGAGILFGGAARGRSKRD